MRDETTEYYDKKIEEVKEYYEAKLKQVHTDTLKEIEQIVSSKDSVIAEKDKLIYNKDLEISKLKQQVENQKNRLNNVLNSFIECPNEGIGGENMKLKAQRLEKRLNKLEKIKDKNSKVYEIKLATLQREKHLDECSLQLQLIKQRAQVVNEVNHESQEEMCTALDRLETKYKEIVANVQATAIERRKQDQTALETILHAVCGDRNTFVNNDITNSMFDNKPVNRSWENESSGYCLNRERLGELFERIYIPQRDGEPTK